MQTETTTKKLFTVDEYYKMAEAGIFSEPKRTELINGEIFEMSPMGAYHSAAVSRATELFVPLFKGKARVQVQLPVRLNEFSELQPDLSLVVPRRDYYRLRHPGPSDVFLALEISDTSLRFDRDVKSKAYAAAGIREAWIEDLQNSALLVFRDPSEGEYKTRLTFHRGDSIALLAFPEIGFLVDELFAFASE